MIGASITFTQNSYTVEEAERIANICVTLDSGTLARVIEFSLVTLNTSLQDYVPKYTSLNLTPTTSRACASVVIMNDTILEAEEEFAVSLQTNDPSIDVVLDTVTVVIEDSSFVRLNFVASRYNFTEGSDMDVCVRLEGQIDRTVLASIEMSENGNC